MKNYQLNSTGMNFLFTDFLTTKFWLKISGKNLEKLLKALLFSKFLYRFAKNAKDWMPSKKQKKIWNLDFGSNYLSDIILVTCQKFDTWYHIAPIFTALIFTSALLILVERCWYWWILADIGEKFSHFCPILFCPIRYLQICFPDLNYRGLKLFSSVS